MAAEARVLQELSPDTLAAPHGRRAKLRSVPPAAPEAKIALREVARVPARLLAMLPVPFTARLRAIDGSVFHLSTSEPERSALSEVGAIVLDAEEWSALVVATEGDRAWPADLVLALRTRGTSGRLKIDALLDGVAVSRIDAEEPPRMSVALMLARIGARLEDAWVETEGLAVFP